MTREEFVTAFRGRMLVFLAEAWSSRRETPSQLGLLMDEHSRQARHLLTEMYEALRPKNETPANGTPVNGVKRV